MWDDRCQWSFDDLKHQCTMAPILAYTDFTRLFKLHTDACKSGLGAVLYQTLDNGMDAVIAYASRSLTKAKSHYPAHKLEFLPLKWAVIANFMTFSMGQPLMSTQTTTPWSMSWQQPSWMLPVTAGWPAWPITTFSCIIGQGRPTLMWMPWQECSSWLACLIPQMHTFRLLKQQYKPCRRLLSKGSVSLFEAYSSNVHVLDPVEDSLQVISMTTDDWCKAQWADPVLGLIVMRLQEATWANASSR